MRWRPDSLLSRAVLAVVCFFSATSVAASAASDDAPLLRALAIVEHEHAALCPETSHAEEFEATVDRLADELRTDLASGGSSVLALNRKIFGVLGVRASADLKDPCNLL